MFGLFPETHSRVLAISKDGHVGFFDHLDFSFPGRRLSKFTIGWITPGAPQGFFPTLHSGLLSFLSPGKERVLDTNTHGEPRAFVQSGVFEQVTPMDVLPTHLLKSILAEDLDEMEALGIYEVIEEDLALCEFVDVSKHKVQEIVREGIDLIQHS
ncbi:MAG: hypothetical protein U5K54_23005 [Cytophagales bacterium]|nr:hypothetical protein [Cytophagales bacterium]